MKKRILTLAFALVVLLGVFTAGVYAHATWMNFTGDEQVANTENNIDEIMEILRDVHEDKLTAEAVWLNLRN